VFQALETIGIVDLFDAENADLSEFSEKPNLAIGTAIHKSYVEVNEEGSEAAAATVLIDTRSGRPLEQTRFICNHPFIFFIHDNAANTVLFMGAFRNPKLTQKH
jgi:serine protease inhibitor